MFYISTRGDNQQLTFSEVVLKGIAPDGGLYVPMAMPKVSDEILTHGHEWPLIDFAMNLLSPFIVDDKIISPAEFKNFLAPSLELFESQITPSWSPLHKNIWALELFHGPTLSFKDVGMQFLGRLFDHILTVLDKKITIVAATSGDTGSAAIHALRHAKRVETVVFHPAGKVSEFQRKQMTTVQDSNIHNISIKGSFDDCQDIVKKLLGDEALVARYGFSAVNSINWARVLIQMVYHARAAVMLHQQIKQPINIVVPSGNFGNMLAGYYVKQMGLPIDKLLVATNENDVLYRFFNDNNMTLAAAKPTHSPSMDIQISSNLERYLYDVFGKDAARLKEKMLAFRSTGELILSPQEYKKTQDDFYAIRVGNEENLQAIKNWFDKTGEVFDPHSAIALHALEKYNEKYVAKSVTLEQKKLDAEAAAQSTKPWLVLATADARKFISTIEKTGLPAPTLDGDLEAMLDLPEKLTSLDNNFDEVKKYLHDHLQN